jgi:hypothetical protein
MTRCEFLTRDTISDRSMQTSMLAEEALRTVPNMRNDSLALAAVAPSTTRLARELIVRLHLYFAVVIEFLGSLFCSHYPNVAKRITTGLNCFRELKGRLRLWWTLFGGFSKLCSALQPQLLGSPWLFTSLKLLLSPRALSMLFQPRCSLQPAKRRGRLYFWVCKPPSFCTLSLGFEALSSVSENF